MALVDEVLFEFRGQLSISDIYQLTNKELSYLREHRREMMSNSKVAEADALQTMAGM